MEKFVVIMAGGVGSRFWPRSRKKMPKQLINIFGQHTMIQDTILRLKDFIDFEHIYIITNKVQKAIVEEQLPEIPADNIIAEPKGRNTAPCVGLAASIVENINPKGVIVTLPADHLIQNIDAFHEALRKGCEYAYESEGLLTFGITPTRPETGYGYINFDRVTVEENVFPVIKFVEKPDIATARQYLASGNYLWNSGMFVWRADVILSEIKKYMPDMYKGLRQINPDPKNKNFISSLNAQFPTLESISIDYGIMEKSEKVFLVRGDFDWSDVGSWESVFELSDKDENGNVLSGDIFAESSSDTYVFSPDKFTAIIGTENLIIINTDDALLVCRKDKSQYVKKAVEYLKERNRNDLL